jgi:hypothetical protein
MKEELKELEHSLIQFTGIISCFLLSLVLKKHSPDGSFQPFLPEIKSYRDLFWGARNRFPIKGITNAIAASLAFYQPR